MKKVSVKLVAGMFILAVIVSSCGLLSTAPKNTISKVAATYDFTPPEQGATKSANISFALLTPSFAKDFMYINYGPFSSFSKSMAADYVEMITKRGYKYFGPVNSYEELVYNDKKNNDFILETELDFVMTGSPFKKNIGTSLLSSSIVERYSANGEITLSGKINFFISEPFTHTKLWVKSIPIEPQTKFIKSSRNNYEDFNEMLNDPQVWNSFVELLSNVYTKSLQTSWKYLEPEELLAKKKEAEEIRKNSSYNKF